MLRRNMDDIFDEIVGGADAPKEPKRKGWTWCFFIGIRKFNNKSKSWGRSHVLHNDLPDIQITSHHTQKLLNFSENISWVSNIHDLIQKGYWRNLKKDMDFVRKNIICVLRNKSAPKFIKFYWSQSLSWNTFSNSKQMIFSLSWNSDYWQ